MLVTAVLLIAQFACVITNPIFSVGSSSMKLTPSPDALVKEIKDTYMEYVSLWRPRMGGEMVESKNSRGVTEVVQDLQGTSKTDASLVAEGPRIEPAKGFLLDYLNEKAWALKLGSGVAQDVLEATHKNMINYESQVLDDLVNGYKDFSAGDLKAAKKHLENAKHMQSLYQIALHDILAVNASPPNFLADAKYQEKRATFEKETLEHFPPQEERQQVTEKLAKEFDTLATTRIALEDRWREGNGRSAEDNASSASKIIAVDKVIDAFAHEVEGLVNLQEERLALAKLYLVRAKQLYEEADKNYHQSGGSVDLKIQLEYENIIKKLDRLMAVKNRKTRVHSD